MIRHLTGLDVIHFGNSGNGNLMDFIFQPITRFHYLKTNFQKNIEEPQIILAYFYEGNDLIDNLDELSELYYSKVDRDYENRNKDYIEQYVKLGVLDPTQLSLLIDKRLEEHYQRHSDQGITAIIKNSLLFKLTYNMCRELFRGRFRSYVKRMSYGPKRKGSDRHEIEVKGQRIFIPEPLQAPGLPLSNKELDLSLYLTIESFRYLAATFKNSKVKLVYIPSPMSIYDFKSPIVRVKEAYGRSDLFSYDQVKARSDYVFKALETAARENSWHLIDTRAELRKAARSELIHGPVDWDHPNKKGYEVLSKAVVRQLTEDIKSIKA